ncbi:pyrroloquinoline quinone biosynthesis protein PqqF [Pantoea cypripedii]|uniref:Coenzyme PQQ synthesis protein F n=1 Tax=Pantoea cypripedii TaxID=55209 RepID=A0A6B9G8E9_PANCY|nr:pyrroloquinoline quinone biosynthesis protein PqqF [Pantoea cypripedii]QGY29099.1 pyrroloquinoline quinone biosynthesis protein PqqF [Pantoea cypripedii]
MTTRSLRLTNGLRCHLHHQPDARAAAALLRVEAGSLQEPDRWPGLAHLLEHLLFCGSEGWAADQRLMPWVQQQGGQVNATTQLSHSAFFFQVPVSELEAGVARLVAMLAAPLLTPEAIAQESAVIDAEYRLLQRHAETLSEAALLDLLAAPREFQRFRVGSLAAFGDNVTNLRQALCAFLQQFYVAGNMELWLQGPQTLDELAALAERYGQQLLPGVLQQSPVAPQPAAVRQRLLQLPGSETFWLTLLLSGEMEVLRDDVSQLRRFWLDDAPGSLLAQLRAAGLCEDLSVQWLWRDTQHSWLALKFTAHTLTPQQAQCIQQHFSQHLRALAQSSPAQRQHYQQLAQEDFSQLSPLEQLRGHALSFAPGAPADFSRVLNLLQQATPLALLTQCQLAATAQVTQGFNLSIADWPAEASQHQESLPFWFYPQAEVQVSRALPDGVFPLLNVDPVQPLETLLLRPAFYQPFSDEEAEARQRLLRPVLAALRHAGGRGSWQAMQGSWQLVLHLPGDSDAALTAVAQVVQALSAPTEPHPVVAAAGIAIRQLLSALPQQLVNPPSSPRWQAAWCGHNAALRDGAARALSELPGAAMTTAPLLNRGVTAIPCAGSDQALLLFIPLGEADDDTLAALRALALIYEPRFFQQLRVEQQIGYVVTARYQRVADIDGILLALQSPDIPWRVLLGHCKRFLRTLDISAAPLEALQQTLLQQCAVNNNADAALAGLRQQQGLPELTAMAIHRLTLTQLQQLHQRLLQQRRRWRILFAISQP